LLRSSACKTLASPPNPHPVLGSMNRSVWKFIDIANVPSPTHLFNLRGHTSMRWLLKEHRAPLMSLVALCLISKPLAAHLQILHVHDGSSVSMSRSEVIVCRKEQDANPIDQHTPIHLIAVRIRGRWPKLEEQPHHKKAESEYVYRMSGPPEIEA